MVEQPPCNSSPAEQRPSNDAPEDVLAILAALLGVNFIQENSSGAPTLCNNCALGWDSIPWEPFSVNKDDELDVDFSSFPSLSLDRSQEEELWESSPKDSTRRAVEDRVSSLLSRPILVTNANKDTLIAEEGEEEGEGMDIVAEKVSEVPGLMLQNFYRSFTTLMNSRLRAYATFLARHGISLLETSSATNFEEGVVGVEQKIETMLEIGRLASTNAIVTSFHASKDGAKRSGTSTDEETTEVSMPVLMDAAIDISLPRPWGGQSEVVTVAFQTVGTITGIFPQASGKSLLRVVEVDLDMTRLLACMMEQAASVISTIVEMTNAIYSLSLPPSLDEAQGVALHHASLSRDEFSSTHKRKSNSMSETAAVVSPPLQPTAAPSAKAPVGLVHQLSLDEEDSKGCMHMELTAKNCEQLVDVVLHEAPESVLSPPTRKKMKIVSNEEVRAFTSSGIAA